MIGWGLSVATGVRHEVQSKYSIHQSFVDFLSWIVDMLIK